MRDVQCDPVARITVGRVGGHETGHMQGEGSWRFSTTLEACTACRGEGKTSG